MGQQSEWFKNRVIAIKGLLSQRRLLRRTLILCLLSLLCLGKVSAVWSAVQDPRSMLSGIVSTVMSILKEKKEVMKQDPQQLKRVIQAQVIPSVDFEEMARWVAGKNAWKAADNKTKIDFMKALEGLIVNTYANALLAYDDQSVQFLPLRESFLDKDRIQVGSVVQKPDQKPMRLDYRLIRQGEAWRVYDLVIEGVSLVQGYRSEFMEDIQRGGLKEAVKKMKAAASQTKQKP